MKRYSVGGGDEGEACSYQECWLWLRGGDEGWVVLLESGDGPGWLFGMKR